ncbi:MAG: FGGY-family carbohydrate kinase [bacterium]|nr:FGGY-family carbohydrate kinase [bacterium]
MAQYFLGLDSSTQSLSAILIDLDIQKVVYETSINYDQAFPHYTTQNGVLSNPDPKLVHTPPLMWAEALDLLFDQMRSDSVPLAEILAVSGSGQQHGSVYLTNKAPQIISNLNPSQTLVENLDGIFSRPTSPIWMDSSTTTECEEICTALGGLQPTTEATGSTTFERFTGPQIRKFYKTEPDAYNNTAHIGLVSSFMASLLAGRISPIDHGDGAGMNLMDIQTRDWHTNALNATAPDLTSRLPALAPAWTVVGPVSSYFTQKYALNPEARALVWSGDNPCSVIGLGLIREGMVAISLGTSDTYFGTMKQCRTDPHGEGHVFVSPTGGYMTLICFKNGSLAREQIRDAYNLNWDGFSNALQSTVPGNDGKIMLPYFEPEIVPNILDPGVRRFDLDESDAPGNCRAVVEAQMTSMRIHSEWMNVSPSAIYTTGGASENADILQIMADVQNCPVHRFEVTNSAALGAAIRAAHGFLLETGENPTWEALVSGLAEPVPNSKITPVPKTQKIYDKLIEKYATCEKEVTGR